MPALIDAKHEAFAQCVAAGASLTQAAREAGVGIQAAPNWGSRKAKLPEVATRILELQKLNQSETNARLEIEPHRAFFTESQIVTKLVSLEQLARKQKQLSVAHACIRSLAELGGLIANRAAGVPAQRQNSPQLIQNNNTLIMTGDLRNAVAALRPDERKRLLAMQPELASVIEGVVSEDRSNPADDGATENSDSPKS